MYIYVYELSVCNKKKRKKKESIVDNDNIIVNNVNRTVNHNIKVSLNINSKVDKVGDVGNVINESDDLNTHNVAGDNIYVVKVIKPILLYGCEVWGMYNTKIVETFYLKFLKNTLKLSKRTPSIMVYGEIGRTPLEVGIKSRLLNFWGRIISGNQNKLSYLIYNLIYEMHLSETFHSDWIVYVKNALIETGEPSIW